jgi:hypothetical protein
MVSLPSWREWIHYMGSLPARAREDLVQIVLGRSQIPSYSATHPTPPSPALYRNIWFINWVSHTALGRETDRIPYRTEYMWAS